MKKEKSAHEDIGSQYAFIGVILQILISVFSFCFLLFVKFIQNYNNISFYLFCMIISMMFSIGFVLNLTTKGTIENSKKKENIEDNIDKQFLAFIISNTIVLLILLIILGSA